MLRDTEERRTRLMTTPRSSPLLVLTISCTMLVAAGLCVSGCNSEARLRRARLLKARSDLRTIHAAAGHYKAEYGRWPGSIEEMVFTPNSTAGFTCNYDLDPWDYSYVYRLTEKGPEVTCFGADGMPEGVGDDADLFYPDR